MSRQKRTTKLLIAVGLAAALLTTASVAFGTDGATSHSSYDNLGKLDLIMNDAQGDKFVFTPTTGSTTTQALNTAACRINPDSGSLVSLTANDDNKAGLKDHVIGVKAKTGEGSNGTPCSRINNSFDTNPSMAEILTIEFTNTLSNYQADYAQLGLKLKFGATARIDVYSGAAFVQSFDIPCLGANDCGADSGNDRVLAKIDPAGNARFNKIVIKVLSPSDGSVSLIDDPGFDTYFNLAGDITKPGIELNGDNPLILTVGDPFEDPGATVTDNFDDEVEITGVSTVPVEEGFTTTSGSYTITYNATDSSGNAADEVVRAVNVYDGALACGNEAEATNEAGYTSVLTRLDTSNDGVTSACATLKPYNFSATTSLVTFDPGLEITANYRGDIVLDKRPVGTPPVLQYDRDSSTVGPYYDMQPCNLRSRTAPELSSMFPELASNLFPTLTGVSDGHGGEATWCIVASRSVTLGNGYELHYFVTFGNDDPGWSIR